MDKDVWYGKNNRLVRCPVPDCTHTGTIITMAHCRLQHGMEREEVGKLYGPPEQLKVFEKFGW